MLKEELIRRFQQVRKKTEEICQPLFTEDYVIQSMPDVSPPKWHLAHTTWFFETFVLSPYLLTYNVFDASFSYRFNSYYQTIAKPYLRSERGLLSRPTTKVVYAYRDYVNSHILSLLDEISENKFNQIQNLITWGLQHEQQHQELLLMDIKYNFSRDPDFPSYQEEKLSPHYDTSPNTKPSIEVAGGLIEIGHAGRHFCFDNEIPRHQKFLRPYLIAPQLVTNREYLEFIEDNGYVQARWWLADGWDWIVGQKWFAPLYWQKIDSKWHIFTLHGLKALSLAEPVSHISYYEADAYAKWRGYRLPTEEEWEHYVSINAISPHEGNFLETGIYHPQADTSGGNNVPKQFFGDLWEWTASPYSPYPGYKTPEGSLGEYNGKFMNNQVVLRGGCCATPQDHIRASYRNFFQPEKRWQFSGIRLAAYL
ncbi:methyltransferase [Legionella lansingensis]|uniref:Methyltransferase n=1 Tax=Legionella lansingensis TaxID=45067 RepID=A0A0W0VQA0_9GAMM|nr:ergothioneine biosynthesis protein EgtB [Legionella lansingensis]KTD22322.1 methyltransferase [Legionella lansingensis]SNV50753.1 methyltransferase [Legionella lansingensis]